MPEEEKHVELPAAEVGPGVWIAVVLAWVVPGAGHFYLRRRARAVAFLLLVSITVAVGWSLDGNLYRVVPGQPLSLLATLASMGTGAIYAVMRFVLGYRGNVVAAGYEYGTAFLLTAGLMNLMLVLDCWDIGRGRKP